ncbi:hypothetical protein T484DRAFT_3637985 [Baffinella frigidus]|nr:hypothetical protein T484DRAFT_3637985 [Cryptophyta sp. CCMP2293]
MCSLPRTSSGHCWRRGCNATRRNSRGCGNTLLTYATRSAKPETRHPKHGPRIGLPETRNPKPETESRAGAEPSLFLTRVPSHPTPLYPNPAPCTLHRKPQTPNP